MHGLLFLHYTSKVCTDLKVGGWSPRDFKGLTVIFIIFYKVQLINETNNEWMGMGAGPLIYFIYIKRGPLPPPAPKVFKDLHRRINIEIRA